MKLQEGPRNTIIMLKADLVHRVMGLIREGRAGRAEQTGRPQGHAASLLEVAQGPTVGCDETINLTGRV